MLNGKVSLHDIRDAEAFVIRNLKRVKIRVNSRDEWEDLVAEGLLVLCEMASKYEPDKGARFSTFAIGFWPQKVGDAWHRRQPEHVLRTQGDGSRKWVYLDKPGSFEQGMERNASITDSDRLRVVGEFVAT